MVDSCKKYGLSNCWVLLRADNCQRKCIFGLQNISAVATNYNNAHTCEASYMAYMAVAWEALEAVH